MNQMQAQAMMRAGEHGEVIFRDSPRSGSRCGSGEATVLLEAMDEYLQDQDALDNRELSGPNAEDYFVLVRRRNAARRDLDAAIAAATGARA